MKRICNKKWLAAGTGLLLLIAGASYTVFISPLMNKEQWVYKESTVERGTLTVGVTESGTLDYGISSILYSLDLDVSEDDGDEDDDDDSDGEETVQKYLKIEEVYAAAGQRIEQGDALIKLTEDSVADVRRLLQSALVDARSDYSAAESEYDLAALEAKTAYDTQQVEGKYASSIYKNADASISGNTAALQVEIQQRNANIPLLKEKVSDAQETYDETLEKYEEACQGMEQADISHTENFMTYQKAYLSAQTQYQNAKDALQQAQQNLEDNAEKIASLEKELTAAKARTVIEKLEAEEDYLESVIQQENAQVTYNAQLENLKETLEEAEEKKTRMEERLQDFEEFVGEDGILYADGCGIVTQVAYEAGDRLVQTGPVLSYAAPDGMTVLVDVTQEDVVDLSVGDKVEIVFSAYKGTPYEGCILSIDTTATSENSNTVSYQVVIGVEGNTEQLYGGMTADITFVTEQKDNVLFVTKKAIVEENGRSYVYRKTGLGGKELVEVETGISNGVNIEIVSGLSQGDTIYIASKVSSQADVEDTAGQEKVGTQGEMTLPDGAVMPDDMDQSGDMQMHGGRHTGTEAK